MEKLAIIDMGSNSIRFLVLEIADNNSFSFVYQEKETIRLGLGLAKTGKLRDEGMQKALQCLTMYKHLMSVMNITTCLAVATAAVRNATNGQAFLEQIYTETQIKLDVISGEREAYLGYLGVINTIKERNFLLFDLGGASIELTLVRDGSPRQSVSLPIGAVTLMERFQLQDNITEKALQNCEKYIRKTLSSISWLHKTKLPLIGIGGTARTFAKMNQKATNYDFSKIHNYHLSLDRFLALYMQVVSKPHSRRKKIPGLSNDRVDVIVSGAAVLKEVFALAESEEMIISGCGLREGIFYEYYTKRCHFPSPQIPNILDFSITNFIGTLGSVINQVHNQHVTALSLQLFDQLQSLHHYGQTERQLLMTAARLHDIGKVINFYNHARHSAFMIGHAPLYGLTHREQLIAAFIAGFHHGISRKTWIAYRYANMASPEDWVMIRKLSTLLAIADAADITYEQVITECHVTLQDNIVVLVLTSVPGINHDASDSAIHQYIKQFKKEFNTSLVIVWK